MTNNLKGKDIIVTSDWTKDELDQILDLAIKLKSKGAASRSLDILKGKTLMLLFFRTSTRTRTSFQIAMQELGGFVQCPDPKDLRLSLAEKPGTGETIKDTALVLERYVDALGIRLDDPTLEEGKPPSAEGPDDILRKFADCTKMPVINLMTALHHPTQAIADLMVMQENVGDVRGRKAVMMWAYSPLLRAHASPMSTGLIGGTYGMHVTFAYPEGYDLHPGVMSLIKEECSKGGGKLEISHDLKSALKGADFVYPRNWHTLDYHVHTTDEEKRLAAQHKDWRLTDSLMKLTNKGKFIHCMPFDRGNEVDDSVADGPNSIIYDEAENLVHVRKALLASLLVDDKSLLESI
jgi:N-acetylornithine carbamoyltransferase